MYNIFLSCFEIFLIVDYMLLRVVIIISCFLLYEKFFVVCGFFNIY